MKQSSLGPILLLLILSTEACMRVTPTTPGMPAVLLDSPNAQLPYSNAVMVVPCHDCSCRACEANAMHVKQKGETETAQPMTKDVTVMTGTCAERTFTCVGASAGIELFVDGVASGIVGRPVDMASFTATCNAAGRWEYGGMVLSAVECSYAPSEENKCKLCTKAQIEKLIRPGKGAKEFTDDSIDLTETCAKRIFTCDGILAGIETFDPDMVPIGIVWAPGPAQTATLTVTCNADGTGWVEKGKTITAVECSDAFEDMP